MRTSRLLPLAVAVCGVAAASSAGAAPHQADAGYFVLVRPAPALAMSPGPGVWAGFERNARPPRLSDLAHRFPRARLHVGAAATVRLPFAASAVTVTALRPTGVTVDGDLIVKRSRMDAALDGQFVSWRVSGAAAIIVVYAVDASGRGTASGRFIGRLASAKSCRGWTVRLRAAERAVAAAEDDDGEPTEAQTARVAALRKVLRDRCVSPEGVRRPD